MLLVHLLLQLINLGAALHQFLVRRHEQTHDHQPDREDEQDVKNSVESLPDCSLATLAEIGVRLIHLGHCSAVHGFVTKFFFDSQQLIVLGDAIASAKRPGFNFTGIGRHSDIGNSYVLGFARPMADHRGVIVVLCQINCRQCLG